MGSPEPGQARLTSHIRIAIVGSGFGGLGTAIRLRQEGIHDFLVFERAEDIGGVWRDNSYPGCACDVQSHLYSFSFARNPNWSRAYSPRDEIHAYLGDCVQRFAITPHLRLGHTIERAAWDDATQVWRIATNRGDFTADIVVSAVGGLSEPRMPALPGLATFKGRMFHSARWDHAYDLAGKRIAVVGTGASAIQFIPEIQPTVATLAVFQRTPPWVMPRSDRALSERSKAVLRASSLAQLAVRGALYAYRELIALAFVDGRMSRYATKGATRYLRHAVPDPVLRAKVTPSYQFGCKRILVSNDYYPALSKDNVTVETSGIAVITEDAVIARDGTRYPVDAIIFGTGFEIQDQPFARLVYGRDGRSMQETWGERMTAHLGTTVGNFPNLFMLLGPNTALGHSSVIVMIEAQIGYLLSALRYMERHAIATIEPRRSAQDAWIADVDRRTAGTAWVTGGCDSWYLDEKRHNSTLWPTFTFTYKRRVARFDPREYVLTLPRSVSVL